MINKLTERLFKAFTSNKIIKLSNDELKFIYEEFEISDIKETKLLAYLIVNTKNNVRAKTIDSIKSILSLFNKDFKMIKKMKDNPLSEFSELKLESVGNLNLTFYQHIIWKNLDKNLILSAGTGFGKTTLFMELAKNKNPKNVVVICVPTELLEQQLIHRYSDEYEIGNNIYKDKVLVITPEKLELLLPLLKLGDFVLFDEAHTLLDKTNDRSVFALEVAKKAIDKFTNIHFASPFLSKENIEEIKSIFPNTKHFSIISNKPRNPVFINKGRKIVSSDNYVSFQRISNPKESDISILVYCSSKKQARELAYEAMKVSKKDIFKRIKNLVLKTTKNHSDLLEEIDKNSWDKYIFIDAIKTGICYFHSDMPTNMKAFALFLVENKIVNKVFATNAILNGIDLPFDKIIIKKATINRKNMNLADFNNLRGRAGRWTSRTRSTGLGVVILDESKENADWAKNHFKDIDSDVMPKITLEEDFKFYTKKSLEMYKNTGNKKFLTDIRINPDSFDNYIVGDDAIAELIENISYRKAFKKEANELRRKIIEDIFEIYNLEQYDSKYRTNKELGDDEERTFKNMIISATSAFLFYNLDVDTAMRSYKHAPLMKKIDDHQNWTDMFERRFDRVRTYGKFFFTMFYTHLISVNSKYPYTIYHQYGTFDDQIVEILESNEEIKDNWIKMIDSELENKSNIFLTEFKNKNELEKLAKSSRKKLFKNNKELIESVILLMNKAV